MKNALVYGGTTYDNDALRSVEMNVDTSLSERSLDVDTIHAVVDTRAAVTPGGFLTSEEYQFVTHDGYDFWCNIGTVSPAGLPQNEPVRFLRGGSQYSLWFRDSVKRIGPTLYEMVMTSSLGRLAQMPHKGGIYTGELAEDVIDDICGVVPHTVAPAFANVALYGWLPYVSPSGEDDVMQGSAKDNLMQVLFALNATVRDDANGVLVIDNLSTAVSSVITEDKIYRGSASVEYEAPITEVTVLEHQYVQGTESRVLFDGTASNGQVIVFYEPMSGLQATGFTILESGDNYCVLSAGTGELTGIPYMHTTREISRSVSSAPVPNAARVEDATLVSITNSADVADRLADYYAHRIRITADAIVEFEDAGDVVSIYDPFDKIQRDACVESIYSLRASNVMKGRINALVGFTPWQVEPFSDERELLTGSGTWTVPAGVTRLTAIIIGGGSGGDGGLDGAAGEDSSPASYSVPSMSANTLYGFSFSRGDGGAGGAGGLGGAGGNILRVDITVDPGDTFSYSCGSAGTGGAANGGTGTGGTDTTFGAMSSASGSPAPSGYTEIWNGVTTTFGADGLTGGAGGGGGHGGSGSSSNDGENGGDAGVNAGGAGGVGYIFDGTDGSHSYAGGGGGGGAAYSNAGTAGSIGDTGPFTPTYRGAIVGGGGGGAGANGDNGANAATYGTGGGGGHGGAGGGGAGALSYRFKNNTAVTNTFTWYNQRYGGAAGTGGSGGNGAPGCIILYYREPVTP